MKYLKFQNLTYLFIAVYTLAAIVVSVNRFWQYQNFYFDFGIFDSAIWKVSRFEQPLIDHVDLSSQDLPIFADHFSPSIFLISPLYWITNRSEMLLVVQALSAGFGGLIAFKLADSLIKNKLVVFSLVFAFLGYVGLQNALISDFHEATVAVLPLTLLFWACYKKRWKTYFVCLIILLGFKESFAGLGLSIALFILLKNLTKRRDTTQLKVAAATALISIIWGIVAIKLIIPHFSGGRYLYAPATFPKDPLSFLREFTTPVLRFQTMVYSFLTFGFLPLLNISILPAIFENFFERFVLTVNKGQDLGMHYNAPLSPLLFVGAMDVFLWLQKSKKYLKLSSVLAIAIIISVTVLHRFTLRGPLGLFYNRAFYQQNDHVDYVNKFVNNFPHDGLIMTQNDLAVRLTHYNVKLLRPDYVPFNPDHVILNLTPGQNPNSYTPLTLEQVTHLRDLLLKDKSYSVKKYADELYIFSKIK